MINDSINTNIFYVRIENDNIVDVLCLVDTDEYPDITVKVGE